jgi:hypothetical protein
VFFGTIPHIDRNGTSPDKNRPIDLSILLVLQTIMNSPFQTYAQLRPLRGQLQPTPSYMPFKKFTLSYGNLPVLHLVQNAYFNL